MAFVVLAIFIAVGILFDMIGVAVTSATAAPFHSMASHRERGAAEALKMLKNAEKVTSICNDVVGDISGIISGTTAAVISARMISDFSVNSVALPLIISGVVACTTIGGKAAGKSFAMRYSTQIVLRVGKILSVFSNVKIKAKVKRKSR
jgi:CBS domain containing-hemolysin-like protein